MKEDSAGCQNTSHCMYSKRCPGGNWYVPPRSYRARTAGSLPARALEEARWLLGLHPLDLTVSQSRLLTGLLAPQLRNRGGNKHHLSSQKSQERQRGGMMSSPIKDLPHDCLRAMSHCLCFFFKGHLGHLPLRPHKSPWWVLIVLRASRYLYNSACLSSWSLMWPYD